MSRKGYDRNGVRLAQPKKYMATLKGFCPVADQEVIIEEPFEDCVYQGEIWDHIEDVVNDWAYERFDKGYYKILSIREIGKASKLN